MHFFRARLILALIVAVVTVSLVFTYFDMLSHRHVMRLDLERRTEWMLRALAPAMEQDMQQGNSAQLSTAVHEALRVTSAVGLAVYDSAARRQAADGSAEILSALPEGVVKHTLVRGALTAAFGRKGGQRWLAVALPLHNGQQLLGAAVLIADAGYIHREDLALWHRSFGKIAIYVVLIVLVTLLMLRWFLLQPMMRVAERLRLLRIELPERGLSRSAARLSTHELGPFQPLAREVETLAESLYEARQAAANEARLREQSESVWTAERLGAHLRGRAQPARIFAVSNREPCQHVRKGREILAVMPPSGLVTAIEPVLRACDGIWVAAGSGDADRETVDERDHVRVPPDDPRYTLRRVWLTPEQEERYYEGFSNEGLWPLCHIAHTRPIFRAEDWEAYRLVNECFARALLEEMEGCEAPVVFVQDYHFALLPRLIKQVRPDARVAIFWHIPWPNPEAFGICPWQAELLDGLLGADLVGFHIPLHCNNFLGTVDRAIESRIDREHRTVERRGHASAIRAYPISVAPEFSETGVEPSAVAAERKRMLAEFGVEADRVIIGVDRLDYTKGIEERLMAFERLLEEHGWYAGHLTMVQIAAPSRTRIPSYAQLRTRVLELVQRINQRHQTARWRPVVLIERQCGHAEVTRWYRVSDLCLVTSLHDGMNLVAKEYVAARSDEDGVLVLSKFTGAAVELQDALVVNPYDIQGVAEAIHAGLGMEEPERRLRMSRMRRQILEHNIYRWAAKVLDDLQALRLHAAPAQEADARDRQF